MGEIGLGSSRNSRRAVQASGEGEELGSEQVDTLESSRAARFPRAEGRSGSWVFPGAAG